MNRYTWLIVTGLLVHDPARAAECNMSRAFDQPDDNGGTTTAVWQDAAQTGLLFADAMHVNTDGTRRSYSVSDFWGEKTAINNLCNAMSDKCAGMGEPELRARRILTQDARAQGWPKDLLAQTRIDPQIIPLKGGKPCPEVDGFLVSATALHKAAIGDVCDIANYTDAMTVPAIVLPGRIAKNTPTGFEARNARLGDLAAVMTPDGKLVFAVVGDTGPRRELGEGTVALAGALLGKTKEPENYREVRGKKPFVGKGWDVKKAFVLIFPGTRKDADPYMTRERIDADAQAAFDAWGGIDRLKACSLVYKRN